MNQPASQQLYWSLLQYDDMDIHLAATSKGLCFVGSPGQSLAELEKAMHKRFPIGEWVHNDDMLEPYKKELIAYWQGTRISFTIPLDYAGTAFQLAIWDTLCHIPYGQTLSYSDIAQAIARPTASRAVGAAIGANPLLIAIPCHRVIGKRGALTGYRGGIPMKMRLLDLEGRAD
ncbi:methylated-DNA--[protein]-cysteine S-methyltransferase [Paenibacillus sinopodophylli]|uniref:methylated-DNA--[protein]-cysteine S-methyltransferase n=1 Tax=Paenibacillus sinopodophylli TaxID=1837342 RepID=UPI00110CFFAF|nr:methylated-DNA--[protein]-cysteine S-methyltransferase [Paenibacillus sinopodophylli]